MFFSDNAQRFIDFQHLHLKGAEGPVAKACDAALNLIVSEMARYDHHCTFMPEYSGDTALKAMKGTGGDRSFVHLLYFLTACIREVTMVASTIRGFERDALDRFKSPEVASDRAWDGWHEHYVDLIFNLLPYRKAFGVIDTISEARREIASEGAKIKEESAAMATVAHDLKADMKSEVEGRKTAMFAELDSLEERIEGYKGELEKHAKEYNFVNLSEAFRKLIGSKNKEVNRYAFGVACAGILALAAPIGVAIFMKEGTLGWSAKDAWSAIAVVKLAGLVGIELLLLYYFRITLKSFFLAKDHHANLSLRLALCQFIDGYCEFAGRTRDRGVSVMQGFEDLIFSPLPYNEAIPPTIDGLDGIVKVAAALRPAKP